MPTIRSPRLRNTTLLLAVLALGACDARPTSPDGTRALRDADASGAAGAVDASGAFFVGNFSLPVGDPANAILRYDARGNFIDAFVPSDMTRFAIPCCFTFGPDDHLYAASPLFDAVLRFNGATGEFIDEFVSAPEGGITRILIPQFGPDGNLYVGEFGAGFTAPSIRRYDGRTGAFIDVFVEPNGGGMVATPDPQQFTWGPDGHLYVSAPLAGKVLRFDGATGEFLDAFITNGDGRPPVGAGLVFGTDGLLYVGSPGAVARYDARTGEFVDVFVESGSGGSSLFVGILFGPDGHLYVADAGRGAVLRYDGRTGDFVDEFIPRGTGGISGPRMIAFRMTTKVCHRPPGRSDQAQTLSVGQLDAADHVRHGDRVGAC